MRHKGTRRGVSAFDAAGLPLILVPVAALWMAGASCAASPTVTFSAGGAGTTSTTTASSGHGGQATSSAQSSTVGASTTVGPSSTGTGGQGGAGGQGAGGQSGTGGKGAGGQSGTGGQSTGGQSGAGGQGASCDGGCAPLGIAFTGLDYTQQYGNSTGGQVHEDPCPTGQVVIGYQGYLHPNGYHGQIQAQCGIPSISGSGPYSITIATGGLTTLEGLQGDGVLWTLACPANQVVVGFSGRSGALLDFLSPDCAPLSIAGTPGNYTVAVGAPTSLPGVGDTGGNPFPDTPCPAGEVATENHLRTGDGVDYFGIGCSKPVVTY